MNHPIPALHAQPAHVIDAYPRHAGCVLYAEQGRALITTGMEPVVRLWNCDSWSLSGEIRGHTQAVTSAVLTRDESRLITTSTDKSTRIWSFPDGAPLALLAGHRNTVTSAALSPDETYLATASYDGRVLIYNFASGAMLLELKGHARNITSVAWSPDGTRLASSGLGSEVLLWNMPKGNLAIRLAGHATVAGLAGWDAENSAISTYDSAGVVRRFRAANGALLSATPLNLSAIAALQPSPDGALYAATAPHTLALFAADTLARIQTVQLKVKGVYGLAWHPAGRAIACSAADGRIRVWEFANG